MDRQTSRRSHCLLRCVLTTADCGTLGCGVGEEKLGKEWNLHRAGKAERFTCLGGDIVSDNPDKPKSLQSRELLVRG